MPGNERTHQRDQGNASTYIENRISTSNGTCTRIVRTKIEHSQNNIYQNVNSVNSVKLKIQSLRGKVQFKLYCESYTDNILESEQR